jgi:ComF family protein
MNPIHQMAAVVGRLSYRQALDLVFPPLCVSCETQNSEPYALCNDCWSKLVFVMPFCERCGLPFEIDPGEASVCAGCYAAPNEFSRARSVFHYDDASRQLILAFKHGDRLERAPALAHWLSRAGRDLGRDVQLIVPVPLHRTRLWRRRYKQAAILAKILARQTNRSYAPEILERVRATPSQGAMPSAKARKRNVLAAFRVPKSRRNQLQGMRVLLVDDVYTTGATLNACARVLKRAGAARVDALTLARVVRPAPSTI